MERLTERGRCRGSQRLYAFGLPARVGQAARAGPSLPSPGVAPMNADSGPIRGQRHIRGGRAPARKALYMAALCATLHNPLIKTYYKASKPEEKPPKSP